MVHNELLFLFEYFSMVIIIVCTHCIMFIGYIQFSACVLGGSRQRDLFRYRAAEWECGATPLGRSYNLTFLLLSDTQAEDKQVFSIRLTLTSSLTEIHSTSNSVIIIIRANDDPHGVFSIDPNSMLISLKQELLSRILNFTIVRNQGLLSDATVFYSLYYTHYGYTDSVHILSSFLIVPDGQMGYEEYIPISVSTFIGTNGNLTLRLTSVTAVGTAVTGLPWLLTEYQLFAKYYLAKPNINYSVATLVNTNFGLANRAT